MQYDFSAMKALFASCPDDSLSLIVDGMLASFFNGLPIIEMMDESLKLKGDKTDKPKIRKNRIQAIEGIIAYASILLEEVQKRKNLTFKSDISDAMREAKDIVQGLDLDSTEII